MDKSTLSNYGWIIIMVLTLSIFMAFATPFGKYVGRGASSIFSSMVSAGDKATDENEIDKMGQKWEDFIDEVENEGNKPYIDPSLEVGILEGTWVLKDTLTNIDNEDECLDATVKFTFNGISGVTIDRLSITSEKVCCECGEQHSTVCFEAHSGAKGHYTIYSSENSNAFCYNSILNESTPCRAGHHYANRTITFTSRQTVNEEFWYWFVTNATKIS